MSMWHMSRAEERQIIEEIEFQIDVRERIARLKEARQRMKAGEAGGSASSDEALAVAQGEARQRSRAWVLARLDEIIARASEEPSDADLAEVASLEDALKFAQEDIALAAVSDLPDDGLGRIRELGFRLLAEIVALRRKRAPEAQQ